MLDIANEADSPHADTAVADLGPLAWVFEELRKSLDGANKAIKRFVRETEQSRNNDLEAVDPGSLRLARQQLHMARAKFVAYTLHDGHCLGVGHDFH